MANSLSKPIERSLVTILIIDTVKSTDHIVDCDPDEAEIFLDRIFERIRRGVEFNSGHLVGFRGDGGTAVFGWPNSLEDHADRACEAAWQILNPPEISDTLIGPDDRPVRFRAGIHSGLVGLRQISMELGKQLDTVGATVSLAAALEKRAPVDGVLISSKTAEICRKKLDLKRVGDVPVMRKINATVHQLCGPPKSLTVNELAGRYPYPVVGRVEELGRLKQGLQRSKEEFVAMSLIGEPGIGKSRLAAALLDEAHNDGCRVLAFFGDAQKRNTPFSVMRSFISQRISQQETESSGKENGPGGPVPGRSETDPLQSLLTNLDDTEPAGGNYATATQVARSAIETFLEYESEEPVTLLVEDYHLVDPESRHCLELLLSDYHPSRFKLLLTSRPESADAVAQISTNSICLEPMPTKDMFALSRQFQGTRDMSDTLLSQIIQHAEGIPFVLEQIARSVGASIKKQFESLPQTVESAIHARLNNLSPNTKKFVQGLSILGVQVERELATSVLDVTPAALQDYLLELENTDIIHRTVGDQIRFRHTIIAEACATTVPNERRKRIHLTAVDAISTIYSDLTERYERLASHAEGAGDDEATLEYLWLAGLQARRNTAIGSLMMIFERAMNCIERIGEPAEERYVDFVLMPHDAMLQRGEFTMMRPYLQRAVELAGQQNRPDKVCAAMCHMGIVCWYEGRYTEGVEISEKALDAAERLEFLPHIYAAKFAIANNLHSMGALPDAISMMQDLREQFSGDLVSVRLGSVALPSTVSRAWLGAFLVEIGEYSTALEYAEQALVLAQREKDTYSELLAHIALGMALPLLDRSAEAEEHLKTAKLLADRDGYDAAETTIVGHLASVLVKNGKPREALEMCEAWLAQEPEQRTGRVQFNLFCTSYAEALFHTGKPDESLEMIDKAISIARQIDNPCAIVGSLGIRASLRGQLNAHDTTVRDDLAEQAALCEKHGLVAWKPW